MTVVKTVTEFRKLLQAAKEQNAKRKAVEAAVARLFVKYSRRLQANDERPEDYSQTGWTFLLSDRGRRALELAADAIDSAAYLTAAVYRHLWKHAGERCGFGKRYENRPKALLLNDRFWEDQADTTIEVTQSESELRLLLPDAPLDVRRYLEATSDGWTDCEMKDEWGLTRTAFNYIRDQARRWLAQQYPEEVGRRLNAVPNCELLERMESLYRWCVTEDRLCSVLFLPDDGNCFLWGQLSEVVGRTLGRPVGFGPRLALDLDEVLPAVGAYMADGETPAPNKFWSYHLAF